MLCYSKSLSSCRLQVIAILGTYKINQKDNNLFLTTEDSSEWFLYSFETYLNGKSSAARLSLHMHLSTRLNTEKNT